MDNEGMLVEASGDDREVVLVDIALDRTPDGSMIMRRGYDAEGKGVFIHFTAEQWIAVCDQVLSRYGLRVE